jgi:hypothetical protein
MTCALGGTKGITVSMNSRLFRTTSFITPTINTRDY